mgnify:CR=1 FL=1
MLSSEIIPLSSAIKTDFLSLLKTKWEKDDWETWVDFKIFLFIKSYINIWFDKRAYTILLLSKNFA